MSLRPLSPPAGYQRDHPLMVLPLFQLPDAGVLRVNESKLSSLWYDSPKRIVFDVPSRTSLSRTCVPSGALAALGAAEPVAMNIPSFVDDVAKMGRAPPLAR